MSLLVLFFFFFVHLIGWASAIDSPVPPGNGTHHVIDELNHAPRSYLWLTIGPLVFIPLGILVVRVIKYAHRVYLAKKDGYGDDLLEDPLGELGLHLPRTYDNSRDIRRIKKEQRRLSRALAVQAAANAHQTPAGDAAVDALPSDAGSKQMPLIKNAQGLWVLAPFAAAEGYLNELSRLTASTWKKSFSPAAVREWYNTSPWARIWLIFQVVLTLAAIVNYVLLTYHTLPDETKANSNAVLAVDFALGIFFLADYMLTFYSSEDRLAFYFSLGSIVELIAILPTLAYPFATDTGTSLWYLGVWRILKAGRIVRTYKILSFSQTEERRELTILGLLVFSFLFFSASMVNLLEVMSTLDGTQDNPKLTNWHDAFYFIIVTFSTIGYGDLTASAASTRFVMMLLVICIIVAVPLQTSRVSEIYNATSSYQRAEYKPVHGHSHVIISGKIDYAALLDFCREFFHGHPTGHIVLLVPEAPSNDIKKLLRHPFYRQRMVYLHGSSSHVEDLRRANARHAVGLFFLNNEDADLQNTDETAESEQLNVTRGADASILMNTLVAKRFFPGLPIFSQVQDIRSPDLAKHCGCDRVLCLDFVKMTILARNCVVPGLLPVIFNLVHAEPLPAEMDDPTANPANAWAKEYFAGLQHQIFAFKFPAGLLGLPYLDVVWYLYRDHHIMLLGVSGTRGILVHPGPDYRIGASDIAYAAARHNKQILFMQVAYRQRPEESSHDATGIEATVAKWVTQAAETEGLPLRDDAILPGPPSVPAQEEEGEKDMLPPPTPAVQRMETTESLSLGQTMPLLMHHIVICGGVTARGARQFVQTIRKKRQGKRARARATGENKAPIIPIVFLCENLPSATDSIWQDTLAFEGVHVIQGTSLKRSDLQAAQVGTCRRVLIMSSKPGQDIQQATIHNLMDSVAIFTVRMLQEEWTHVPFTVMLKHGENVKLFASRPDWEPANLRMQTIMENPTLSMEDRLQLYSRMRYEDLGLDESEDDMTWLDTLRLYIFGSKKANLAMLAPAALRDRQHRQFRLRSLLKARWQSWVHRSKPVPAAVEEVPRQSKAYKPLQDDVIDTSFVSMHEQHHTTIVASQQAPKKPVVTFPPSLETSPERLPRDGEEPERFTAPLSGRDIWHGSASAAVEAERKKRDDVDRAPLYLFDPHFAAGMMYTPGLVNAMLCQLYFRPYLSKFVHMLTEAICHERVPPHLVGQRYAEIKLYLNKTSGTIVLGLYKHGRPYYNHGASPTLESEERGRGADRLPYALLNCAASEIVAADDLLFVLSPPSI